MRYYKTIENFPIVRKGIPCKDETEITEEEYKTLCDTRNTHAAEEKAIEDAKEKPKSELDIRLEKIEADIFSLKTAKEVT